MNNRHITYGSTYITAVCIMLMLFINCKERVEPEPAESRSKQTSVSVPVFNSDSAFYFVAKQTEFGPRVPGTEAHAKCADWFEQTLKRYTDHVFIQPFAARAWNNKVLNGKNIIATFNPDIRKRILLCAHWDSRPYADYDPDPENFYNHIDGANDGASGVGVLLEIARILSVNNIDIGIDIILFDLEDYGEPKGEISQRQDTWALGSQHWARSPHIPGYNANFGILLDMVGAENATFYQEGFSMMYAPDIVRRVWRTAHRIGYGNYFIQQESNPITDDHYYINTIAKIPTINIIHQDLEADTGFFKYWHTMMDTIDIIDPNTLNAVGQTVLHVIYNY